MDTDGQHQHRRMRGTTATTSVSTPFHIAVPRNCSKRDESPIPPKRLTSSLEEEASPTASGHQHLSHSPKSTACDLSSSLPKMPTRKASVEPTTPTVPSSCSASTPVPLPLVTFDGDHCHPHDDNGHDAGRKQEEEEEQEQEDQFSCSSSEFRKSSSSLPTLFLHQRRSNLKSSVRVGSLKRAGTSYLLNQREDMEYQHHGRRRSAPAGTVARRAPGHSGGGSSRRNSTPRLFDDIASAAAIVAEIDGDAGDAEEEEDQEDIEEAFRARDRILRTTSLDFVPLSASDLKM
mmetsp:Transcript_11229/g.26654  ORF Transcript_11229/g.26654 Transcript_11229/m.26654 type:complete len:290 (-) Transcript_11229:2380-3249(-)